MPKIKPFRGIRPSSEIADKVVLGLENLSLDEAKIIRSENPYSYVNMLIPKIENQFMMGSKRELTFKKINENFEDFLDEGILRKDEKPALYVYQVKHKGITQTGIWTVTSIDDYLNNTVKKHELTRADRELALIEYLQQTGIDANPVLVTYQPVTRINEIIEQTVSLDSDLHFEKGDAEHLLWKIDDESIVNTLVEEFSNLQTSYIADGHHRAAAAALLGIERRKRNLKHTGNEEYNFFTTVYMATNELQIFEFYRLLKDIKGMDAADFISRLEPVFDIEHSDSEIKPEKLHELGLYLDKQWYRLQAKTYTYNSSNPVSGLDVQILQKYILEPVLGITDPRTDPCLSFEGGLTPVTDLVKRVENGDIRAFFTLYPTSIEQLIKVADAGEVMPPKSTWFEPKTRDGLVVYTI